MHGRKTVIISHRLPPGLTVMFSRDQLPSLGMELPFTPQSCRKHRIGANGLSNPIVQKGGSHEKVKTYPPTAIRTNTHAGRLAELAHSADSSPGTSSTGSKSGKGRGTDRPAGFKGRCRCPSAQVGGYPLGVKRCLAEQYS